MSTDIIENEGSPGIPQDPRWTMSNALVRAGHGLNLVEKRLVVLAITKSRFDNTRSVQICAQDYADQFGLDLNSSYDAIKRATDNLFERYITFFRKPTERRKSGKDVNQTITKMRWVSAVHYEPGAARVSLDWTPDLIPYLHGLKKEFTQFQLTQTASLRSIYSWKLFELLHRFRKPDGTGWAIYGIEDLHASLETPQSLKDFAQLKRRVLDPAVKELRRESEIEVEYRIEKKAGRRVTELRFDFRPAVQGELPL